MSRFRLDNRIAVVTGGAGTAHGIGRSIALALATAGANVVVTGRTRSSLESVVQEIRNLGGQALALVADVTDADQVETVAQETVANLGRIDIWVNNVGGASFSRPEAVSSAAWKESIALNLDATFFGCSVAGKQMIDQNSGSIINIASSAGVKGDELAAPYAAAKAAVMNLTRSLAISWADRGVNVNCIAPGAIKVPDHPVPGMPADEYEKRMAHQSAEGGQSLQLPGEPDDVANAVVFFASQAGEGVTGETLMVRGAEWVSAYS